MKIALSPKWSDRTMIVSKSGDALTINGAEFDFSGIPDGATLPADAVDCEFIAGDVERIGGELHLTLLLPHGSNPSHAVAFPTPIANPPDGQLELPK